MSTNKYGYTISDVVAERKFYFSSGFQGGKTYPENQRNPFVIQGVDSVLFDKIGRATITVTNDALNNLQFVLDNEQSEGGAQGMFILESVQTQTFANTVGSDYIVIVSLHGWLYGQY